jgi:AcrR family transcriptional regulator
MLYAMARAVAEHGYVNTAVADVLERAGVSRRTFYELFTDKEDCFLATLQAGTERLLRILMDATAPKATDQGEEGAVQRFDRVLGCYLDELAVEPPLARTFIVEVYAAGPAALEQRWAGAQRFVDMVADIFAGCPGLIGDRPDQRFAVEALVGGIGSMIVACVGANQYDRLGDIRKPSVDLARDLTIAVSATPS